MPTAVKVRIGTLNYGWLFKIESFLDLTSYWEKVRSNRVQAGFSNLLRSRELAVLTGVTSSGTEHMSHPDAFGIYTKCLNTEGSCFDAVDSYSQDLVSGMLESLRTSGAIYINSNGGYFTAHPSIEETDNRDLDQWALPTDKINVSRWPGGKHWYASVGGVNVTRNGESKWSTKAMAQINAERWAQEHGIKIAEEDE